MTHQDEGTDAVAEKASEKWMARFQLRLAVQPGVDRAVVLQAVEEITEHRAKTGEDPRTAFGDPDSSAVEAAARLVPANRAARARRQDSVLGAVGSALKRVRDIGGM
ncbi:hypothetical protein ABZ714_03455 [Streptomyces sp. NPDC006798]|uniref:hypothetical protein n=1 Tax=Streptomyces sp. NPDC006798 TaxID=3155462 RepID=UPI0033C1A429